MTVFRIAVLVLGVIHALFVGLTSLVGAFADGGDVWQRLLVMVLHPLGAAGVLLLVFVPSLTRTATRGYRDHRWGTFKQVKEVSGQVRRGESGSQVL